MAKYVMNDAFSRAAKRRVKNSLGKKVGQKQKTLANLRTKAINQRVALLKKKYKMGRVETSPGDFIRKMNEDKSDFKSAVQVLI